MSPTNLPKYTTVDSIRVRLANKVQFESEGGPLDGELPDALLFQLIKRAETKTELELRSRYAVPFRSKSTGSFVDLPDHTKAAICTLIDDGAVMIVLKTDFGRGSHINAEGYIEGLKEDYEEQLNLLLGHDAEGKSENKKRFRFSPPLEDLMLSATNREADDGYKGMIINTDQHRNVADYAGEQINDPSKSYLNRRIIVP